MTDRCLRCNRILKNPKAKEAGYGRICLAKEKAAEAKLLAQQDAADKEAQIDAHA